jgi:2-polyprenyl-3-methyl-5-hydroxy-6-metoxy-1,4-benzoquinol methylase
MSNSNCDADTIQVWGISLKRSWLNQFEADFLQNLPGERPNVEWIWREMDSVWDALGLDNTRPLQEQNIGAFYGHPIWTANGIFTKTDDLSMEHRIAICREIEKRNPKQVLDYGGGWGGLASVVAQARHDIKVTIVEPFQSPIARELLNDDRLNIEWKTSLDAINCELIVAQDVLEHLEAPVSLAAKLVASTKPGGVIIFANSFYPVIKCHLPKTFYLRHTFPMIMRAHGMLFIGSLKEARHIQVFLKSGNVNPSLVKVTDFAAKIIGPFLNWVIPKYISVRNGIKSVKNIFS